MTRPSLAGIEKRAAEATPGPWVNYSPNPKVTPEQAVYSEWLESDPEARSSEVAALMSPRDAAFIADARTAVPALTAAVRDVLALHYAEPYAQGPDHCAECDHQSPCPTVRALAAHFDLTDLTDTTEGA